MTPDEQQLLIESTQEAFVAHTQALFGLTEDGFVHRTDQVALMACPSGITEETCTAFRLDPTMDPHDFFDLGAEVYGARGLDFTVLLRDDNGFDDDLDRAADERHLGRPYDPMPRMIATRPVENTGTDNVVRIENEVDVKAWIEVAGAAFAPTYPVEAMQIDFTPAGSFLAIEGLSLFLTCVEEQSVAAGMSYRYGDTTYLCSVGTLPEARGKGAAGALVRRATNHAFETGSKSVFLFASHNAPTYERIGFETVSYIHHRTYYRASAGARPSS